MGVPKNVLISGNDGSWNQDPTTIGNSNSKSDHVENPFKRSKLFDLGFLQSSYRTMNQFHSHCRFSCVTWGTDHASNVRCSNLFSRWCKHQPHSISDDLRRWSFQDVAMIFTSRNLPVLVTYWERIWYPHWCFSALTTTMWTQNE